jgi:hypothetical protein
VLLLLLLVLHLLACQPVGCLELEPELEQLVPEQELEQLALAPVLLVPALALALARLPSLQPRRQGRELEHPPTLTLQGFRPRRQSRRGLSTAPTLGRWPQGH